MTRLCVGWVVTVGFVLALACLAPADQPAPLDLSEFKTVATARTATLPTGPANVSGLTGYLGVVVTRGKEGRLVVEDVQADSAAAKAGLKTGDVVTRVEKNAVVTPEAFREWLQTFAPGTAVKVDVEREGKALELTATLSATSRPMSRPTGKGGRFAGGGPLPLWQKPVFRCAVLLIEFSDVKHNAKVPLKEWEEFVFSTETYTDKKNATGQIVQGSVHDYFLEQSAGAFRLEGKVFDWVHVGKKRGDYVQGTGTSNKTAVLKDTVQKVLARDGKDALDNFDGLLFLYAGERSAANRGAVYYPHAGGLQHQGKRLPYLLTSEGGARMTPLNGMVKLVGLMLGLPDLAARQEDPGSRGLGAWCALSNPNTEGRPQHFGAWAKQKLGWIKPAVIDPTVRQKLILAPIEDSPRECFKVLVRPNGSEYYLLENRRRKGFDADLPAEGLLIWRVVHDRPTLCEAHGVEGPSGPLVHLREVPFPSAANHAFTPNTIPSSLSPLGGGLPVHITEIRRLLDGRITFVIGTEYR